MSKRSDPRFTRAMMALIPLAAAFRRRGGDAEAVLARNNLPLDALTEPTLLIEASACYAAIEDMAESLGDRYFAAQVALEAAETGTPALRTAASHATTLGGFLARVVIEVAAQVDNVRYRLSDPPPLKWSDSKYGFRPEEDLGWQGRDTSRKRLLRSCVRWMS
ncbi:MAG TPA: AraC family transcriptional regulator ligand-binding domain-containing protein [Methyloceanibacter sp.]|nr:AraC family transcriptional regulator ligand-binding domain-containing protein [Methyloceanibacter sp.]